MNLTTPNFGPLAPYLLDLAAAFQARNLPLLLVGGAGLLLRRQWRLEEGVPTLINSVPVARTTDDFDLLLRLEVLANAEQRLAIREVLTELGYQTHDEHLQYIIPYRENSGSGNWKVKVDFLAPKPAVGAKGVKVKGYRVGGETSKDGDKLHGHITPEALLTDEPPLNLMLDGWGTDGIERRGEVLLPHPFTLLIMKLHAFRDAHLGNTRYPEPRPELAHKHVADVYSLVALLTQEEEQALGTLGQRYAEQPATQEAASIVLAQLSGPTAPGTLVLREALSIDSKDLQTFLDVLEKTFL